MRLTEGHSIDFLFCPAPKHCKEIAFHCLGAVSAVLDYLIAMVSICQTSILFVLAECSRRRLASSRFTIARSIWRNITDMPNPVLKSGVPSFPVKVHSTRSIGALWAFQQQNS